MSIATQIEALTIDKTNIKNAILAKGGTVNTADGFDNFAADIATIPERTQYDGSLVAITVHGNDCKILYLTTDDTQAKVTASQNVTNQWVMAKNTIITVATGTTELNAEQSTGYELVDSTTGAYFIKLTDDNIVLTFDEA